MAAKITFHYGSGDSLLEVWTDGVFSVAGYVADAMLNTTGADEIPWKIEIITDADDIPVVPNVPGSMQDPPPDVPIPPNPADVPVVPMTTRGGHGRT